VASLVIRSLTIGSVDYDVAIEKLDRYFAWWFLSHYDAELTFYPCGVKAVEVVRWPLHQIAAHLVLMILTVGAWFFVWFALHGILYLSRRRVRVRLTEDDDAITAEITGTAQWVEVVEPFVRTLGRGDVPELREENP